MNVGPTDNTDEFNDCMAKLNVFIESINSTCVMLGSHCGEYPCECRQIYSRQIRQKVANIRRMGLRMQFATNRNDRKMIARHS